MGVKSATIDNCARCGEACGVGDLVCNRCSETRVRAALPASDAPSDDHSEATLDERLTRIEGLAGEKAYKLLVGIDGSLAGESTVVISVLTAPDGPATPPEDVWAEPAILVTFECGTADVVATRVKMAMRLSQDRKLHEPEVRRRLRVGTRGFLGEPSAVGMLLDARLHMARLALTPREAGQARIEETGGALRVLVEFALPGAGPSETPTLVELFSEASPTDALRASAAAWLEPEPAEQKLDSTRNS